MNPSTWRLLKEEGILGFLKGRTLHGYIYLRWINAYVKFARKTLLPRLSRREDQWLENRYHAKVLTEVEAEAIITVKRDVDLHKVSDQMIPYTEARDIVIKQPHAIATIDCACRSASENPCHPKNVCMIIGQPFVDFVMDQNPSAHRLSEKEALQLLKEEHERGHVHAAWFKDACIGRFYAICNCCKCCCTGVKGMKEYGMEIVAASGYVAEVDESLCIPNCSACEEVCIYDAIKVTEDGVKREWEVCRGCGLCSSRCETGAITLKRDKRKGEPMDVRVVAADLDRKQGVEPDPDALDEIMKKL